MIKLIWLWYRLPVQDPTFWNFLNFQEGLFDHQTIAFLLRMSFSEGEENKLSRTIQFANNLGGTHVNGVWSCNKASEGIAGWISFSSLAVTKITKWGATSSFQHFKMSNLDQFKYPFAQKTLNKNHSKNI